MAYCLPSDVRVIANLTTEDISDADLATLIGYATTELNHMINAKVLEEKVRMIDSYRENKIDGTNTTYYVQKSFLWYLADMNNDGVVDVNDVIVYQYNPQEKTKTTLTVSSVAPNEGKIVLASAPPAGVVLKITYAYAPVSESDPHPLIKKACAELAAALAFSKIETRDFKRVSLGKLTAVKMPTGFKHYYSRYEATLRELQARITEKVKATEKWKKLPAEWKVNR